MATKEEFVKNIQNSYTFKGETILIGSAVLGDDYDTNCQVHLPLKTLNRHGMISGATGTGKTKSLQVIAEGLSDAGVPVLVMDIKGDLSGLAQPGTNNKHIVKRAGFINMEWEGRGFPIELMSISDEPGTRLKATVSEFGPLLLAKILQLNDTQSDVLTLIFKFCDDKLLPLIDLMDIKSVLKYIQKDGKEEFIKEYGYFNTSTLGAIMRSVVGLEQQEADELFGEPSFDIFDLMQLTRDGKGYINTIRLTDMQSQTAIFSTFMLCLIAEIFQKLPEQGDADKPKLVMFIDEAHLIFKNASKELLDQFETTIKLIRSKGVGIILATQSPKDIPSEVLGQLGLKVQHALRAFTAKDRKAIKLVSENYPISEFYDVDQTITQLGIGEAFITALDEKGRPTELVHTLMRPPYSRMDILSEDEIKVCLNDSRLISKYNRDIDRNSAYEILEQKLIEEAKLQEIENRKQPTATTRKRTSTKKEKTIFDEIISSPVSKTIARELTRGLLGVLGLKKR